MWDWDENREEICTIDESQYPIPKPILNLQCHDKCGDGTFATVDRESRKMICRTCPANTYSIASGGIRVDGSMGAFGYEGENGNVKPLRMDASCKIQASGNQ